jgi:ubiquinone/menaquinone biosynthesis C-methylase UbiE
MTRSYFNNQAEIWDNNIAETDSTRLENMVNKLDIQAGYRILDVGTGTGILIPYLVNIIGDTGTLFCLDSAEKMLEKARQKNFKGNIKYVCSDITSTKFASGFFDAVVCYSSFPHFLDKYLALTEINRLLRKGGRLYICHTASRSFINKIHRQVPELSGDLIPDKPEMLQLLSSAGFEKIDIREETSCYLAKADKR